MNIGQENPERNQLHQLARRRLFLLPPLTTTGVLLLSLSFAQAQIVVNSTGDKPNAFPLLTGVCSTDIIERGECTLRAAIQLANFNPDLTTITFNIPTTDQGYDAQTQTYTINIGSALELQTSINIVGLGAGKLTVQATGSSYPVFDVTTNIDASVSGLSVKNGQNGIRASSTGTVNVSGCIIAGNGSRGVLNSSTGTLNLTNCIITSNFGGVDNDGTMAISDSTVSGNSTSGPFNSGFGQPGFGGGIANAGTLRVSNSTISGNTASGGQSVMGAGGEGLGGGVYNGRVADITDSTIYANSAAGGIGATQGKAKGGGIFNEGGATLRVTNSTISANTTAGVGNAGGGIFNVAFDGVHPGGVATVKSAIIALNDSISGPDVDGSFMSAGFNLIGKIDGSTGFSQPTDHIGTTAAPLDPKLDPAGLKNNGGPTQTVAILRTSIAINNGAPDSPSTDQRGVARVNVPDIGAFEFNGNFFAATLQNISTRGLVGIGDEVMIGGFIISGTGDKKVLLRAIGPSLSNPPVSLTGTLQDPTISLFNVSGKLISNDNWADASNAQSIDPGLRPTNGLESAILISLPPGAYTAIVSGVGGGTGIGLVEVFDMDATVPSKLSNISTRGLVETGDNVLIGGLIIKGPESETVGVRAIGPSLGDPPVNLTNVLQNPFLGLFNDQGNRVQFNDDWQSDQANEIIATGLQPSNMAESVIVRTLTPGNYTAIVTGVNGTTGIALVEVYGLN